MKISRLPAHEVLAALRSSPGGLSADEARRRLADFGRNEVAERRGRPLILRFLDGLTHFFALILWAAAILSFVAEHKSPGQGMATLGWAIVGVIFVNGVFSFLQEYRAEQAILALQQLLPQRAKVLRGGLLARVTTAEIVPGDVIVLEGGDEIPADCRVLEAFSVRVSNATITGESIPVERDAAPSAEEDAIRSSNVLLAGTSMLSGEAKAVVFATGARTEFGKIAHLAQTPAARLSPLQKEVARLSRIVAAFATALGAVFFVIGRRMGLSFWDNLLFAIGIIVANVPEGLLPTVTLALAMGSRRMARSNALVRHLPAVETLGAATVICTDKTGTLTQNRMEAVRLFLPGAASAIDRDRAAEVAEEGRRLFEAALLCHDLKPARGEHGEELVGDPMEVALVALSRAAAVEIDAPRIDELPFDPERRMLSTLHRAPGGPVLYAKGALEALLPRCARAWIDGAEQPLTGEIAERITEAEAAMANGGLRVLAFAYRRVPEEYDRAHLEQELTLTGLVGLADPPRPEVPEAIRCCREAGIRVIMVTGDHPRTALAVARQIRLVTSTAAEVIAGERLRRMSDAELTLALDAKEILFARLDPDQKMRIVASLQQKGEIVAVTGDGVNDAPALRRADIGVAMGASGTDVARAASDIILTDDNFASIVRAIEEGRAVFSNIRKFLTYILTSNVPELIPYLAFVLLRVPLALTVIQILAVDLGTDMLPALGLGAERPDPEVMRRPPRPRTERLLTSFVLLRSYLFLGMIEAAAGMTAFFFVLRGGRWRYGAALAAHDPLYLQATAACLTAIVLMQVANVYLCRAEATGAAPPRLLDNRIIAAGVAVELGLILLIDYTPWGNRIFGTGPVPWQAWLLVVPFAAAMLALEGIRKWIARALPGRADPAPRA